MDVRAMARCGLRPRTVQLRVHVWIGGVRADVQIGRCIDSAPPPCPREEIIGRAAKRAADPAIASSGRLGARTLRANKRL
eukprot:9481818-Pyramimonas_sp.AAC.1